MGRRRNLKELDELIKIYENIRSEIVKRLKEFKDVWKRGNDYEIFREFLFCLLTPQSKAKVCWNAILKLHEKNLLLNGSREEISKIIYNVRFKNVKSNYILLSREKFFKDGKFLLIDKINSFGEVKKCRDYLVKEVKGMGYKEASHFLRNVGFYENIAILDRHILKNLKKFGVISAIPKSLSRKKYLEIENKMENFSKKIDIPMSHLDLLLWYKEAGEVFK